MLKRIAAALGLCVGLGLYGITVRAQRLEPAYDQPFRPQVHFSPREHWINDPNGLVFFEGEYHLFYQYNPQGDTWGHMSWGHAVSPDLLHWHELPVAIPENGKEMIFTGSVVVDEHNTSGFCADGKPCLIAIYTSHLTTGEHTQKEMQSIAYSLDRGRSWKQYANNPVIDLGMSNFRDPGVIWDKARNRWSMVVSLPDDHQVRFYTSPDLKHWTQTSTFGPQGAVNGQWECPSLIEVPQAKSGASVWTLKVGLNPGGLQGGSGEQYFLGSFDGNAFKPLADAPRQGWTDYGNDSYCAISFNHLPAGKPPVLIGWMNNWRYADKLPTSPWRGQMTIPREVSVTHDAAGWSLAQTPITGLLRAGTVKRFSAALAGILNEKTVARSVVPLEMKASFSAADSNAAGLRLYSDAGHYVEIRFDLQRHMLVVNRTHAGLDVSTSFANETSAPLDLKRPLDLRIIVDRSSIEVFAQNGTIAMTNLIFPPTQQLRVEAFRSGGKRPVRFQGQVWRLRSIWEAN